MLSISRQEADRGRVPDGGWCSPEQGTSPSRQMWPVGSIESLSQPSFAAECQDLQSASGEVQASLPAPRFRPVTNDVRAFRSRR